MEQKAEATAYKVWDGGVQVKWKENMYDVNLPKQQKPRSPNHQSGQRLLRLAADDYVQYLRAFAARFSLDVRCGVEAPRAEGY